jgi:hypothetical protein
MELERLFSLPYASALFGKIESHYALGMDPVMATRLFDIVPPPHAAWAFRTTVGDHRILVEEAPIEIETTDDRILILSLVAPHDLCVPPADLSPAEGVVYRYLRGGDPSTSIANALKVARTIQEFYQDTG